MKVLVVEDTKLIRLSVRKELEDLGITVLEAETGQMALKVFMRELPDIVSVDIGLPDGNGLELLRELKAISRNINKEVKYLVLSGQVTHDNIVKAYQIGVHGIFGKPVNMADYVRAIKSFKLK